MSSGENLKYQLPKNESGKLKTLTEPGREIQIDFTGKLHKKIEWREPAFNCGRQIQQMANRKNLQNLRIKRSD